MKFLLTIALLLISYVQLVAQEIFPVEIKNGKKFYVHEVIAGNTFYGLQKVYGVEAQTIIAANPTQAKGLQLGTIIFIPVPVTAVIEHTVAKSETIYSISKKYAISQNLILKRNPEALKGLKKGSILYIPIGLVDEESVSTTIKPTDPTNTGTSTTTQTMPIVEEVKPTYTITFADSIVDYTVKSKETLYSISKRFLVSQDDIRGLNGMTKTHVKPGQVLKIPLKKEKITEIPIRVIIPAPTKPARIVDADLVFPKKEKFKVVYLLPFFLDKGAVKGLDINAVSSNATDFWMGSQLALDSLQERGFTADVHVFDVRSDTVSMLSVLANPEMIDVDLIIGPMFPEVAGLVSEWCIANKVRMICPVQANPSIISENPFISLGVASDVTQLSGLSSYLAKYYSSKNVILVSTGNAKEADLLQTVRETFNSSLPAKAYKPKITECKLEELGSFLKKDVENVVVFVNKDRSIAMKVMGLMNKVNSKAGNKKITLVGPREWANIDDFDASFKEKYSFTFVSPNHFSYDQAATKNMLRNYRKRFQADLSKYSVQGFDISFLAMNSMLRQIPVREGIMSSLILEQRGTGNGYENSHHVILQQVALDLIKLK